MPQTTEYKIKETTIPGLLEIDINLFEDQRGSFQEKFQKEKLVVLGFPKDFVPVQQNIAYNKTKGTTRGIHAEPWDKYISVISGKVFAAFVDLRKENFGKVVTMELDNKKAVFVPKGVGNSYQTLEDDTFYFYLVNDHWSKDKKYMSVNLADPKLSISWPVPIKLAIVSEKDQKNPNLEELTFFD